mmetsp:Transcript_24474/g.27871  ORF Transcript_24474/g.27871 Transcript_24474/m.27871 type:complete len:305 (-) Transcript_24474:305-1219(-)
MSEYIEGENLDITSANSDEDNEMTEEEKSKLRKGRIVKIIIGILLVAFIIYVIIDSTTTGYIRTGVTSFLEWIEANPIPGFFIFMVVYFFATVFFFPGSILTLGAGFVFANAFGLGVGVLLGTLSVFFGAASGATMSFILGRYLLRDSVAGLTKKYVIFEALDSAMSEKGLRIMILLRLSPIIPFNAINYIAGVTAISLRAYIIAFVAMIPGTVLYVFLGASAGSLTDSASSGENSTVTIIVIVVGVVFGIAAVGVTSYYAKKELNRVVEARNAADDEDVSDQENGAVEAQQNAAEKGDNEHGC